MAVNAVFSACDGYCIFKFSRILFIYLSHNLLLVECCVVKSKHRYKSFLPEQDEVSFHAGYLRCASDLQLAIFSDSVEYAAQNSFWSLCKHHSYIGLYSQSLGIPSPFRAHLRQDRCLLWMYGTAFCLHTIVPYPPDRSTSQIFWVLLEFFSSLLVIVWRLRGNIIRTAPFWVVWHNVPVSNTLIWARPTSFLQCFDTVGLVIWPVKIVPNMTYNVFGGTLNLALSICLSSSLFLYYFVHLLICEFFFNCNVMC